MVGGDGTWTGIPHTLDLDSEMESGKERVTPFGEKGRPAFGKRQAWILRAVMSNP